MRHSNLCVPPVPDVSDRPGGGSSSVDPATSKFGIGQPVHRREDPTLVRGEGRYTDDVSVEGQVYAAFVRSPYAHGVIREIDLSAAREMPIACAAIPMRPCSSEPSA